MAITILAPIIGAMMLATGTLVQKIVLVKKKIDIKLYNSAEFLAIVIAMIPFIWFFWRIDYSNALALKNVIIFIIVVILSILANLFAFYSMKWEKLSKIEPAKILEPLFVIILAILFSFIFSEGIYERNIKIIIPAIIAGLALLFSHIKKHHLSFNKYFLAAIAGSFFFALELVISKLILDFYSPVSFYFVRCLAILIISLIIFKPQFKKINVKTRWEIMGIGFVWVAYRVLIYYGYSKLGIIFTTLMVMLGPIFIYLFAWKFLKEKLEWKNIVAGMIILGCVTYGVLA